MKIGPTFSIRKPIESKNTRTTVTEKKMLPLRIQISSRVFGVGQKYFGKIFQGYVSFFVKILVTLQAPPNPQIQNWPILVTLKNGQKGVLTSILEIGRSRGLHGIPNFFYRVKFLDKKILGKKKILSDKFFFAHIKIKIFNIWPLVGTSAFQKSGLRGTGRPQNFFGEPPHGVLEAT